MMLQMLQYNFFFDIFDWLLMKIDNCVKFEIFLTNGERGYDLVGQTTALRAKGGRIE
jgi:hypothetical protein